MANEKNSIARPLLRDLFRLEVYKRSQGRITRQVTFLVMAIGVVLSVWSLSGVFADFDGPVRYATNGGLVLAGGWISFRGVNFPRFADFLIAVEAEMNKVSWPSRRELVRSSIVVIFTIFSLATLLFAYDFFWGAALKFLGVTG